MPRILPGGSVFSPYQMPNSRHLRYMLARGYIEAAQGQPTQADEPAASQGDDA